MKDIQKEWQRRCSNLTSAGKTRYSEQNELLLNLLKQTLTAVDIEHIVESFSTMPEQRSHRTAFQNKLIRAIFVICVDEGQRGTLVRLVASKYPRFLYGTERFLVVAGDKYFEDPILILVDAFNECEIASVRKEIALSFRMAFPALVISGEDDKKLLRRCRDWYERNKGNITVNDEYGLGPRIAVRGEKDIEMQVPLFVEKDRE